MAAQPGGLIAAATQQSQWLRQPIDAGNRFVHRWRRDFIATVLDNLVSALEECRKKREELANKIQSLELQPDLKQEIKLLQEEVLKATQKMDEQIRQEHDKFQKVSGSLRLFSRGPETKRTRDTAHPAPERTQSTAHCDSRLMALR